MTSGTEVTGDESVLRAAWEAPPRSFLLVRASQVPSQNICEALELEGQGHDEVVDDPSVLE